MHHLFSRLPLRMLLALTFLLAVTQAAQAASQPPLLLRQPSLSQKQIAFLYADDIWTVARKGGDGGAREDDLYEDDFFDAGM